MKKMLIFGFIAILFSYNSITYAQSGMALSLDGNSGYMTVADHDDLDIDAGENFTVTLWLKSVANTDYFRIENKRALSGTNPGYEMIVQTGTGAFGLNLRSTSNTNAGPPFGNTPVTDGQWHHLAFVVDAENHTAAIFVDGTQEQISNNAAIGSESFANSLPLLFGSNANQTLLMNTVLDNIRIWQTALSLAEIEEDMTATIVGTEPALLAAWDFENVAGTNVPDLTGVHNGLLVGGSAIVPVAVGMVYSASSIITTSLPAGKGENDERLIAVNVLTDGFENPLTLTSISFSLNGTTNLSDISNLKVYFTAENPRLNTNNLFASATVQGGTITVNGNQLLNEGSNHFWITADLAENATEGHFLKAEMESVMVDGQLHPVTPGSSVDQRLIILEHDLLFSGGDYGSVNFRIPAIKTAKDGSLVAAVDARVDAPGDLPNNIDIMIRRSTDMGETWSEALTIADFGSFGASDPSLVVDRVSGNMLCMFASHQGLFYSTPSNPIRYQVCRSQDNGVTWSDPVEHTNEIYAPTWYASWLASGTVHQLRSGRIVGAVGVRQNSGNTISNFMIYSDDAGLTWNYKPSQASATGDEAKIVELDNGNLMMNIRNQTPDCRKIVISEDGGDSWGTPYFQYELIDPAVNGDFIRYTSVLDGYDKSRLLFSTASHPTLRQNLTVFISYDEGQTWPVSKVLNPGPAAYSCLTILSDGTIGCLYENGEYEQYQIYFARFSLDWLTDGNDTYLPPVGLNEILPGKPDIQISPNPAKNSIDVVYLVGKKSTVNASFVNITGKEMMKIENPAVAGPLRQTINLAGFSPGLYFLLAEIDGIKTARKVVVSK